MEVYMNVRNFGKIKEARINISNFTVFVGNNNSGKTQLMELIYAVIKRVSALVPESDLPVIGHMDAFHVGDEEIRKLNQWVNGYLKEYGDEIVEETFHSSIPIEEISLDFESVDINYDIYFLRDKTADYVFEKKMIRQEQMVRVMQDEGRFYHVLVLKYGNFGRKKAEKEIKKDMTSDMKNSFSFNVPTTLAKSIILRNILREIMGADVSGSSNVLFLPASRMGLMLLYKHYFGNSGQTAEDMIRDKNQNSKGIPKPVLDFLSFLLQYSYTERVAKKNEPLIRFIFENLIDGTITERGDATTYIPKDGEKEIPVFVASSMVNEVVPVIKALTDSDRVDFIFYDEVETSMHPQKQIEMVKLLNRLNNHGMKLIVSTHSDTMATKINNLLLLSYADMDLEQKKRLLEKKGITIEKEDLLLSERIYVYQFENDGQGKSSVEELDFHKAPYTGYDFTLFNDSTMTLFEEAKIVMGIEDEDKG